MAYGWIVGKTSDIKKRTGTLFRLVIIGGKNKKVQSKKIFYIVCPWELTESTQKKITKEDLSTIKITKVRKKTGTSNIEH